jgi:Lon protease-like protein
MEAQDTLPLIPMRDVVVFPHMMMPFIIGRPLSMKALDHALQGRKRVFLAAQRDAAVEEPTLADIYGTGCIATVLQSLVMPDGTVKALVEGIDRATVVEWKEDRGVLVAIVKVVPKPTQTPATPQMKGVLSLFLEYVKLADNLHCDAMIGAIREDDASGLANAIASHLRVGVDAKQKLLETVSPGDRLAHLEQVLAAEVDRLRTSPDEVSKRQEDRASERRALRRTLTRIREAPDVSKAMTRLREALRATLRLSAAQVDEESFGARGLSSTGVARMRAFLEHQETGTDLAYAITRVLLTLLDDGEDDDLRLTLTALSQYILLFDGHILRAWATFGVERRQANHGPPAGRVDRRRNITFHRSESAWLWRGTAPPHSVTGHGGT